MFDLGNYLPFFSEYNPAIKNKGPAINSMPP